MGLYPRLRDEILEIVEKEHGMQEEVINWLREVCLPRRAPLRAAPGHRKRRAAHSPRPDDGLYRSGRQAQPRAHGRPLVRASARATFQNKSHLRFSPPALALSRVAASLRRRRKMRPSSAGVLNGSAAAAPLLFPPPQAS